MDEHKYDLKIIVPLGLKILDRPAPEARGAKKRRDEPVGTVLKASDILLIQGVPYGQLIPRDPQKPEFVRISEAGGLYKDQLTGKVIQFDGVLTYCQVTSLVVQDSGGGALLDAIGLLITELRLLVAELRAQAGKKS